MPYERLLIVAEAHGVYVFEKKLLPNTKGLYGDNVICINKRIATNVEKACVLAEEIGHHHTSYGNILDQSDIRNRKQELRARRWSYDWLVPLASIVQAHKEGIRNRHELAQLLDVTEEVLQKAIDQYIEKHGLSVQVGKYTVIFEPLGVLEMFDF
jgi:Zn-dependent peptidase ImmA (M78 family)